MQKSNHLSKCFDMEFIVIVTDELAQQRITTTTTTIIPTSILAINRSFSFFVDSPPVDRSPTSDLGEHCCCYETALMNTFRFAPSGIPTWSDEILMWYRTLRQTFFALAIGCSFQRDKKFCDFIANYSRQYSRSTFSRVSSWECFSNRNGYPC